MKRHILTVLLLVVAAGFAAMSFWLAQYLQGMNLFGTGGASDIDKVIGIIPKLFGAAVLVFAVLSAAASLSMVYIAIRWWLSVR